MGWERLDLTHKLKNALFLRNAAGGGALVSRSYGANGKMFPRIVLSIYEDRENLPAWHSNRKDSPPSFRIGCSLKSKGGEWWQECGLPKELVPELTEMFEEAVTRSSVVLRGEASNETK